MAQVVEAATLLGVGNGPAPGVHRMRKPAAPPIAKPDLPELQACVSPQLSDEVTPALSPGPSAYQLPDPIIKPSQSTLQTSWGTDFRPDILHVYKRNGFLKGESSPGSKYSPREEGVFPQPPELIRTPKEKKNKDGEIVKYNAVTLAKKKSAAKKGPLWGKSGRFDDVYSNLPSSGPGPCHYKVELSDFSKVDRLKSSTLRANHLRRCSLGYSEVRQNPESTCGSRPSSPSASEKGVGPKQHPRRSPAPGGRPYSAPMIQQAGPLKGTFGASQRFQDDVPVVKPRVIQSSILRDMRAARKALSSEKSSHSSSGGSHRRPTSAVSFRSSPSAYRPRSAMSANSDTSTERFVKEDVDGISRQSTVDEDEEPEEETPPRRMQTTTTPARKKISSRPSSATSAKSDPRLAPIPASHPRPHTRSGGERSRTTSAKYTSPTRRPKSSTSYRSTTSSRPKSAKKRRPPRLEPKPLDPDLAVDQQCQTDFELPDLTLYRLSQPTFDWDEAIAKAKIKRAKMRKYEAKMKQLEEQRREQEKQMDRNAVDERLAEDVGGDNEGDVSEQRLQAGKLSSLEGLINGHVASADGRMDDEERDAVAASSFDLLEFDNQHAAAVKIQSSFRGYNVRRTSKGDVTQP